MPWKEIKSMDQREQFVRDYLTGAYPKGALCAVYGISRLTGDKWLARYHAHGVAGLADLARRPHTQPHRTPDALVAAIVVMKHRHPSLGPKTIRDRLRAVASEEAWPSSRASPRRPAPIALVLAAMLVFGASNAAAQTQTAVCSNTPGAVEWIECTEDATSTDAIDINLKSGVNIETTAAGADGILGYHRGTGDITIDVTGVSGAGTITTSGNSADGISGVSDGKGSVDITVSDVEITTTATEDMFPNIARGVIARGVVGRQSFISSALVPYDGVYDVNIDVSGSRISTKGRNGYGIYGLHGGSPNALLSTGNLEITATDTHVTTEGTVASGLYAQSVDSVGDVIINMTGGSIITEGAASSAVYLYGESRQSGNIIAEVRDAELRTKGSLPCPRHLCTAWSRSAFTHR